MYENGRERNQQQVAEEVKKLRSGNAFAHKVNEDGEIIGMYQHPALEEVIKAVVESSGIQLWANHDTFPVQIYAYALTLVCNSLITLYPHFVLKIP
jgi:hypothetical protein